MRRSSLACCPRWPSPRRTWSSSRGSAWSPACCCCARRRRRARRRCAAGGSAPGSCSPRCTGWRPTWGPGCCSSPRSSACCGPASASPPGGCCAPPVTPRRALAALAVVPSCWLVADWVRSWQGFGGPWAVYGASQWQHPAILALAALGGVWLVSFALVAANTGILIALAARPVPVRLIGAACAARRARGRPGRLRAHVGLAGQPARHDRAGPAGRGAQPHAQRRRQPAAVGRPARRPCRPDRLGGEQRRGTT